MPGFRNFLGEPTRTFLQDKPVEERFALVDEIAAKCYTLHDWPASLPGADDPDHNPLLPAGYTYLLQFVGHDIVQSSFARSRVDMPGAVVTNERIRPLSLATLYGGGPDVLPHCYALGRSLQDDDRTELRLGRMGESKPGTCLKPLRELPRIAADPNFSDPPQESGSMSAMIDVLVADGDGDAQLEDDGTLAGEIRFHRGDESAFTARRW